MSREHAIAIICAQCKRKNIVNPRDFYVGLACDSSFAVPQRVPKHFLWRYEDLMPAAMRSLMAMGRVEFQSVVDVLTEHGYEIELIPRYVQVGVDLTGKEIGDSGG